MRTHRPSLQETGVDLGGTNRHTLPPQQGNSAQVDTAAAHPAPFTPAIINELGDMIPATVPPGFTVHDPFAGEGVRLAALCDRLGYAFTGTDLERWRYRDRRVQQGDSRDPGTYPIVPHAVVTSPTYNNGVNDHFTPSDSSRRLTYRVAAGHPLDPNNTGRWSGRRSKRGEREYWRITREVVANWPDIALVNVKNSTRAGALYLLVDLWADLLAEHGYTVHHVDVPCPGWRYGSNHQARAEVETILAARRPDVGEAAA